LLKNKINFIEKYNYLKFHNIKKIKKKSFIFGKKLNVIKKHSIKRNNLKTKQLKFFNNFYKILTNNIKTKGKGEFFCNINNNYKKLLKKRRYEKNFVNNKNFHLNIFVTNYIINILYSRIEND
jgi:hypothetical protein